jgi:hypothetical protein
MTVRVAPTTARVPRIGVGVIVLRDGLVRLGQVPETAGG